MKAINLQEKFESIHQLWHPLQIAMVEDRQVALIKMKGETGGWFNHDDDKFIQVLKGKLEVHFRDKIELVNEGELIVIPKNTEFTPKATEEVHLLVFEKFEPLHD